MSDTHTTNEPHAIILAAGKGTRMGSDLPKVCHEVGGRPMVCAVVDACLDAGCARVVVVVGYQQGLVRDALEGYGARVDFAVQEAQLGTGHAVMSARGAFEGVDPATDIFVLCGDGPLIRPGTLTGLLAAHREAGAAATLATSRIGDPTGYGRIVRDAGGSLARIVEHKNATEAERAIREVNPSYYCVRCAPLFSALDRVGRDELTGEYYITDIFELLLADGERVEVVDSVDPEDILSINTPEQLARVDGIFRARVAGAGAQGVGS